ncbi:metal ABC transporter solute-binding protein, Zn/Mn family [Loigolactobacillus bifermentans]|uniref:ABC transporter substrate-binding protein n=1 Tax=Loigolactobacillus bifermentans DSM 20003 TaxID=1423726 RepID=A0A0R1GYM0_9LACO|nr:zinc ABC transporter substrate-binding protein [Loigolactobacillus bifermentans]KRK39468.1 ABC transporter substrate-binding protein [Loigolactobacillus bifermentans DSM 20003]QGG61234.1 metal ABC transporter substrate-binding protein [Loigolactobacillus bifermentans]
MKLKRIIASLGFIALLAGLAGCGQTTKLAQSGHLQVVASVDFYGEVAQKVLGKQGTVTSIIDRPNVDPHDYEPTTKVGKTVAKADVAVLNGAGYDTWLTKLTKSSSHHIATVSAAKVVGVKNGENEHIWYKPQTMPAMARALAKKFGQLDPKHRQVYQKNAQAYIRSLKPLQQQIKQLKAHAHGEKVAVSEPVFVNALHALGYQVSDAHFAAAIEKGSDPSAKDVRQLSAALAQHQVAFFVQNTQVQSAAVTNMVKKAQAAGVPILKVTETKPVGKTYQQWMTAQYQALAKIQQAGD